MSYQKAADYNPDGPSAGKLHRLVGKTEPNEGSKQAQTVVVDGTQVPAWRSRQLLAATAGAEVDIKPRG
ncbi:MAG TPA: hypothetical protein VK074_04555 [Fodinibius sp.]|nr:hypothetical protein [Fodinibius sp.]